MFTGILKQIEHTYSTLEVLRELQRWRVRQEACPRATRGGTWDHEDCVVHPEDFINQDRFRPSQNEPERQKDFTKKLHCHRSVRAFHPSSTRYYSIQTYISGNKKEKNRLYFSTSALLFISFCNSRRRNI